MIMKSLMGYHYFWAMFLDQNVSASHCHIELNGLIPERKTSFIY